MFSKTNILSIKKVVLILIVIFISNSAFAMKYSPYETDSKIIENPNPYKDNIISWDFSAEYITNNFDVSKSDSIKVYTKDNVYTLNWVFLPDDRNYKNLENNSWEIDLENLINIENTYKLFSNKISEIQDYKVDYEWIDCYNQAFENNQNIYKSYAWINCLYSFDWFVWFSKGWDYLMYRVSKWFQFYKTIMVNIKTWKKSLVMDSPKFYGWIWTKEDKQFIYAWGSELQWNQGLFISKKLNYWETRKILDDYIDSWYIEWNYVYLKSHNYNSKYDEDGTLLYNNLKYYYKVIEIKTGNTIYKEELK